MRAKQLIEKLEDLATFFTLEASDSAEQARISKTKRQIADEHFHEGTAAANKIAFIKVDKLIKEAKR